MPWNIGNCKQIHDWRSLGRQNIENIRCGLTRDWIMPLKRLKTAKVLTKMVILQIVSHLLFWEASQNQSFSTKFQWLFFLSLSIILPKRSNCLLNICFRFFFHLLCVLHSYFREIFWSRVAKNILRQMNTRNKLILV